MHILISGGTGFIGAELCPMLLRRGHYLTILTRHPGHHAGEEAENQHFIPWKEDLVEEAGEADAVINLAGESIFGQRWTKKVKEKIYFSRINNTKKLVRAIRKADQPPQVMVSASAAGYYGGRGGDELTEDEPPGDDFLAQVCVDWEKAAQPVQKAGCRLAIPRLGIVLEKGGGALQKMLPPFRFFVGGAIGRGTQFVPWVHRRDLCRGLVFALQNESIKGPFNLNAPNPVTMDELARALGDVLNRPAFFQVPEFALHLALGEAAKPLLESLRVRPAKLQNAGFEFQFNHVREALSDIL